MKYNVLLADDEYFIRQKMKKIIPWEEWDLNLAGEAENGLQVMKILSTTPIDIILLDIKMPMMDGMKTADLIKKEYPMTKVIILSGYNNFEYVRNAIRANAFDYLLKPVETEQLSQVMHDCIKQLNKERTTQNKLRKLYHYELCQFLIKIRKGKISYDKFLEDYPEFSAYKYSVFLGFYTQNAVSSTLHELKSSLSSLGMCCESMQESDHIYILQLFMEDKKPASSLGSHLVSFVESHEDYMFFTINNFFAVHEDWSPYYHRTIDCLDERFFAPHSNLFLEHTLSMEETPAVPLKDVRETIIRYLDSQNVENTNNYIISWFHDIKEKRDYRLLKSFMTEIFITFRLHYNIPQEYQGTVPDFVSTTLEEEHTLDALQDLILSYAKQCINACEILPSDLHLGKKIVAYIQDNFQNQDLSVSSISDVLKLNSSYMGTVFKGVYQMSITQYITKTRMEHACSLLKKNTLLVSEIADMVGYSDVFYFSKRFKKHYGISPKEYSQKCSVLDKG